MAQRPTLHVAGWASWRTQGHHAPLPAPKYSIMSSAPEWATPSGVVGALVPRGAELADLWLLLAARRAKEPVPEGVLARYRGALEARWEEALARGWLAPGSLRFCAVRPNRSWGTDWWQVTSSTLCCACSVAESRAGRCHRSWLAPFLRRAGWQVVLDGEALP